MSASPIASQTTPNQTIPTRRILINDSSQMPSDYSTTPGGTLYSTTPGGTRIVYERSFLMNLKNSPLSRTPPKNLSTFPDSLLKNNEGKNNKSTNKIPSIEKGIRNEKHKSKEKIKFNKSNITIAHCS